MTADPVRTSPQRTSGAAGPGTSPGTSGAAARATDGVNAARATLRARRLQVRAALAGKSARVHTEGGGLFGPEPTIGVGAAGKAVLEDARALVKAEIALAKAELTAAVREKATGAGMIAAAAVLGWLAFQGLLITAALALALVLPGWAAALIVSAVLLLVAAVLVLVARRKLRAPVSMDTTKRNVEEDVAWTKAHLPRQ